MDLELPEIGLAQAGFLKQVEQILQYSVNTWDRGFLSKLYASTDAPGLAAELILATLNTNVHVYETSPALTLIEKHITHALVNLFGITGPHAGGEFIFASIFVAFGPLLESQATFKEQYTHKTYLKTRSPSRK